MFATLTDALAEAVLLATSATVNDTPLGNVTRACSATVAVSSVVWLVSGRDTVTWAEAVPAITATAPNARTDACTAERREKRTGNLHWYQLSPSGWGTDEIKV